MKIRTTLSLASFLCFSAALQAQVSAPKVGVARYADNTVRSIYGLPANLVVGQQFIPPADAISFSDSAGLVSREGHIQLLTRDGSVMAEYDSGESAPVLNVEGDLKTAIVWLPSQRALLHWDGKSFLLTPITGAISETVTSVRVLSAHSAKLLLATVDGSVLESTISLDSGDITSMNPLAGARAPAFEQHSFVIFLDSAGLEIQSPDGTLRSLPLAAKEVTIERMSSDWLHLSSGNKQQHWALQLSNAGLSLSQLPAPTEVSK